MGTQPQNYPWPGFLASGPQSAGRLLVCGESTGASCGPTNAALCPEWSPGPSGAPSDMWSVDPTASGL